MPTSYSPLLGLALPVTGELAGTWGDTVNNYITTYLDSSVAGTQTISGSQTAVTLSVTNGTTLVQVGSGSSGSAQYSIINCTGNPAATLVIDAPKASKTYVVNNATSTNQSVTLRGGPTTPTTGVTLVAGEKAVVAWNGSDFIKVATSAADGVTTLSFGSTGLTPSTATAGAVTVAGTLATTNGGTGLTSFTANRVFYASSTSAIGQSANLTFDGTTLTAANFTDSSLTSGRVTYATTGGNLTDSANLLFDGTTLTANALTTTSTVTINGGTANGVAYLNGSKVLTTGSALTFSGNWLTATNAATSFSELSIQARYSGAFSPVGLGQGADGTAYLVNVNNSPLAFGINNSEAMRLNTTGLGIGTSSPAYKLDVVGEVRANNLFRTTDGTNIGLFGSGVFAGGVVGIGSSNSVPLVFGTGATERMRLDSSGNLGLGVTPSAWASGQRAIQIGSTGVQNRSTTISQFSTNQFWNGSNHIYINSGEATLYTQFSGAHLWSIAPSSTAGNTISFTTAMTLDASGNLGLGVTPSAWSSNAKALQISSTSSFYGTSNATLIGQNTFNNTSGNNIYLTTAAASLYQQFGGAHSWFSAPSGTAGNTISFTQAMTLDASGNLGVGTTSPVANFRLTTSLSYDGSGGLYVENTSTGTSASSITRYKNSGATFAYTGIGGASRTSYAGLGANVLAMYTDSTAGIALTVDAAGPITFNTNSTERFRIASNGAWGLAGANYGTSGQVLTSNGSGSAPTWQTVGGGGGSSISAGDSSVTVTDTGTNGTIAFTTDGVDRGRFDASGNLLLGTTTTNKNLRLNEKLAVVSAGTGIYGGGSFTTYGGNSDVAAGSIIDLQRSRGTTDGSMTAVASGDALGYLIFRGSDGANFINAGYVTASVDAAVSTNIVPGRLQLYTVNTSGTAVEGMRINSSQGVQVTNTLGVGGTTPSTSGAGITFPATQSASSDANTLDDYEEGTWTPTVSASTPGTLSITYAVNEGTYVKVGRLVTANLTLQFTKTNGTASGDLVISGLPFTARNNNDRYAGPIGFVNNLGTANLLGLLIAGNSTSLYIGAVNGGTLGITAVTDGSNRAIRATAIYEV